MTTQTKCCVRCKDVEIVKGKLLTEGGGYPLIVCKKADCPCHTQKKSIREELQQVVSAVINTVKEHGLSRGDATHDIMSAFDTALEAIAVQVQENIRKPKHQECSNGNHEPCDVCVATDVWNRSQDLSATIIRSHKKV